MSEEAVASCHLCGGLLNRIPGFSERVQVTSDCRPWRAGGTIAACTACNTVQKPVDASWLADVRAIYQSYVIYDQGAGADQMVFDLAGDGPRSARIAEVCRALLPDGVVDVLDIGCGNGAFLRALSPLFPHARLTGTEFDERNRSTVLAIPRVVHFETGDFENLTNHYDLISIIHVLEHITGPANFLRSVARRLKPGGRILIETPDRHTNFFDFLIADHCTHFDRDTLKQCCHDAGLELILESCTTVPKELTFVARTARGEPLSTNNIKAESATPPSARQQIDWLADITDQALAASRRPGLFGIFGTSIAATWLDAELARRADFFVDEDPSRIGRTWLGRPILGPQQVAEGATVFVPLVPITAQRVAERLSGAVNYEFPAFSPG